VVPQNSGELIDFSRSNNCFTYAPHPYDFKRLGIGNNLYRLDLDGIEIFNPRAGWLANMKARKAAKELNKVMLANSDAHTPGFIGSGFNMVDIDEFKLESVMESLFRGLVKPVARYPSIKVYGEWIISKVRKSSIEISRKC
jgi:predicted metal-dependent phosphoesterase TrpH